nr:type II toxin-antitoxin system ParD family antitoxin [Luteitalea pratensis]
MGWRDEGEFESQAGLAGSWLDRVACRRPQTLLNSVIEDAMNVSLTAELEQFVDAKVESGLYNNASEVVREGLRLLKEQDEVRLRWREQIERGWLEAQAGRLVDGPAALTRIKQRLSTRSKKRA